MGCMVNGPGEMADSDFGYVKKKLCYWEGRNLY